MKRSGAARRQAGADVDVPGSSSKPGPWDCRPASIPPVSTSSPTISRLKRPNHGSVRTRANDRSGYQPVPRLHWLNPLTGTGGRNNPATDETQSRVTRTLGIAAYTLLALAACATAPTAPSDDRAPAPGGISLAANDWDTISPRPSFPLANDAFGQLTFDFT
jgi:hypothetical protein